MSALADSVLSHLEQRALLQDVRLDHVDEFIAGELGVPVSGLYAYLLLCFAAERFAYVHDQRDPHDCSDASEDAS